MPSEGEDPDRARNQSDKEGVEQKVRSPQYRDAAAAAPDRADPDAAEKNREFVEDTAMEYNEAEEEFAGEHQDQPNR